MTQENEKKIEVSIDKDLADLIPTYLENRRKDIANIRAALEQGDYETVRVLGHDMKGSGGGYGFEEITEFGRSIEQTAKNQDPESIQKQVADLLEYLDQVHVI